MSPGRQSPGEISPRGLTFQFDGLAQRGREAARRAWSAHRDVVTIGNIHVLDSGGDSVFVLTTLHPPRVTISKPYNDRETGEANNGVHCSCTQQSFCEHIWKTQEEVLTTLYPVQSQRPQFRYLPDTAEVLVTTEAQTTTEHFFDLLMRARPALTEQLGLSPLQDQQVQHCEVATALVLSLLDPIGPVPADNNETSRLISATLALYRDLCRASTAIAPLYNPIYTTIRTSVQGATMRPFLAAQLAQKVLNYLIDIDEQRRTVAQIMTILQDLQRSTTSFDTVFSGSDPLLPTMPGPAGARRVSGGQDGRINTLARHIISLAPGLDTFLRQIFLVLGRIL